MSEIYDVQFCNAKRNASKANVLEDMVNKLKKITLGQIEDEGETIKSYLIHIKKLASNAINDIETRNG